MKNLYILIALTLLFISCNEDDSPTQNNSGQGFLSGKVISNNNLDVLDSTFENISVYLIKSGQMIDSTTTDSEGNYLFNGVGEGVYNIKAKKTTYIENQLENIQFVGKDTLKLNTFKILHPISGIKVIGFETYDWQKAGDGIHYSTARFAFILNTYRKSFGVIYYASLSNNFDSTVCFDYKKKVITSYHNEINGVGIAPILNKLTINSGDKIYFKVYPIQNGVEHSQDSKELGEPVYFEAIAP